MSEMSIPTIPEDTQRILRILAVECVEEIGWTVGQNGVTAIVPYEELGEMARVPWFAVYRDETVIGRIAARHVAVEYFEL